MTTVILVSAMAAFIGILLLYFVFTDQLVELLRRAGRRVAGLKLRSIDVDGSRWPYLEGGKPSGDVLLLLHGFGGDKDNWLLYAPYFKRNYRLIIPDLPGFGDSERNPGADYGMTAQTERLAEFVRALGIERLHVGGNSMGGFLALKFALAYPDTVTTIALLNNAGVEGVNRSELELAVERGESPLTISSMEEFEWLLKFIAHRPIVLPGAIKRAVCAQLSERREFYDGIFQSLVNEMQSAPLNDRLPSITAPTLIIWGRHDRLIDVSCAEVMASRIPVSHCVVFEDIGHIPMVECPAETAAAHLDYLKEHGAAAPA